ncbi:MAG: Na+/H+ antiporter NhaC family protein [Clostridiales bacterium]|nr:Na+/H+ antiporter NhaC family protein [Candidatus Crickella merdequi]
MERTRSRFMYIIGLAVLMITAMPIMALAADGEPALYASVWSLLPPLVAIALALITKEVYSSLFIGVLTGAVLYAGADFAGILNHFLIDGIIASLSDSYNMGIIVFLVVLGMLVAMMNKSGGSKAFGRWAATKVKSRKAAQFSTIGLGCLIFVDDYFNCLTVGSVMKPLTDRFNISRAKLAYLIDATAAPVCIIAPISSWAAAVSGFVEGQNGFTVFIKAIPYNFYALLTIAMLIMLVSMEFDYSMMAKYEMNAIENGDLFTTGEAINPVLEDEGSDQGIVADLLFPVISLIICCVIGMIYSGGFFDGENFIDAFANCDASVGLALGSTVGLVITVIYYICRRTIKFTECMECVPEGLRQMASPILVLTFAWSLKNMADSLGLAECVAGFVSNFGDGFLNLIPAIIFIIACGLGIASGTSWGTFGILIPIALAITESQPDLMIPVISACMAGGVCGDHCSPISDTTIMAGAGAGCNHVSHVETQLPYAFTVMAVAFVSFIIAGFMKSPWVALAVGLVILFAVMKYLKSKAVKPVAPTAE